MLCTTPTTRHTPPATRGITLVEMLISMAVTLIMMAAVVNLFANIGAGVKKRNASMELGGQLRMARSRLFKDLAGATSPARPKLPSDDHDDGYLEIIEGRWSDKNPSALIDGDAANGELDYATSIVPSSNLTLAAGNVTDGGGLGDYDDILALTVRSESEPFVGRWFNTATGQSETIESDLAEIIWYAVENPADGSLGEPGMRTIYRRVLLIAPWLAGSLQNSIGGNHATDLTVFSHSNDISVRRVSTGGTPATAWVPNTLSDLTKRENRFGHFLDNTGGLGFPFAMNQSAIRALTYDLSDASVPPAQAFGPLRPFGSPFDTSVASIERQGEDVMLNDALAFDLRVYDPGAPLYAVAGNVLEPSDSGWAAAYLDQEQPTAGMPLFDAMIGQGSYVDLGYVEAVPGLAVIPPNPVLPAPQPTRPIFDGVPSLKSQLNFSAAIYPIKSIAYDTWPYHYETDGIDQDSASDNSAGVDQGTNGLDDIVLYDHDGDPSTATILPASGVNGVDDPSERETAPPYDTPLRGMQIKLRVYDRDTRQIREATVTRNFVPQ